jgi:hypothetical protein
MSHLKIQLNIATFLQAKEHTSFRPAAIDIYESINIDGSIVFSSSSFFVVFLIFIFIIDLGAACLSQCHGAELLFRICMSYSCVRNVFLYGTHMFTTIFPKDYNVRLVLVSRIRFTYLHLICEAHICTILLSSYQFPAWFKSSEFPFRIQCTDDRDGVEALGFGWGTMCDKQNTGNKVSMVE